MKLSEKLKDIHRGIHTKIERVNRGGGAIRISELRDLGMHLLYLVTDAEVLEAFVEKTDAVVAALRPKSPFEVGALHIEPQKPVMCEEPIWQGDVQSETPDAPFLRAGRHLR